MDEDELRRALAPVREYFSGREVNVDTVLAAYLRSCGLPVSGQPWEAAKRAMSQGAGFNEAVTVGRVAADNRHRAGSGCREPVAHPI